MITTTTTEKHYIVRRSPDQVTCQVRCVNPDDPREYLLSLLHHVVLHSPTGFECGYAGSGPADLALSILAEHFGESDSVVKKGSHSRAWDLHQDFKADFIARMHINPGEERTVKTAEIRTWIAARKEA